MPGHHRCSHDAAQAAVVGDKEWAFCSADSCWCRGRLPAGRTGGEDQLSDNAMMIFIWIQHGHSMDRKLYVAGRTAAKRTVCAVGAPDYATVQQRRLVCMAHSFEEN